MANITINDSGSGSGATFSNTQNVNQNDDTITWIVGGFAGGNPWQITSTSGSTWTPTGQQTDSSGGSITIESSSFNRSLTTGSYSVTVSGKGKVGGTVVDRVVTLSGNIAPSTGTLSITPGPGTYPVGTTFTYSWSSNDGDTLYFNSTGTQNTITHRFIPRSGVVSGTPTGADAGGSGSFTMTANTVNPVNWGSDGAWNGGMSFRINDSGGPELQEVTGFKIYEPVTRGTVSLALTNEDNTNGNFTVTASTSGAQTLGGIGEIGYRFRRFDNGSYLGGIGANFSTNPSLTLGGELRGVGIQVQNRALGPYNNTGGSAWTPGSSGGPGLVSNQIVSDTAITVNGFSPSSPPSNPAYTKQIGETINTNADTEVVLTVSGAQIGDTYRVTKSNGTQLVAAFVASATSFDITVPTTLTEFPTNTTNIVYINVSRAAAQGGDGNETVAFAVNFERGPEAPDYLIKWAESPSTNQLTKNIGATAHNSDNLGSVTGNLGVQITDCGIGDDYRLKLVNGSNVGNISVVAQSNNLTTTVTTFFLNQNELPAPGLSAQCVVEARAPESTEWVQCLKQPVPPFPVLPDAMYLYVNREDYIGVNNVLPQMIFTGAGVEGPTGASNWYVIANNNTTVNPVPQVSSGRLSNQEYRFNNAFPPGNASETINASFIAGATGALVGAGITNSSIGVGALTGRVNVQAWTRVPTTLNGTGVWEACQTSTAVSVGSAVYRDEPLAAFTINTKSGDIDRNDLTQIVPWIRVGDTASFNAEGNGSTEIAWSTTDSTPDGWTTVVSNDNNGLNNYYFSAPFNVAKNTNTTVYVGIRRRSINFTNFVGDATYASISIIGANYYLTPGGNLQEGVLENNNAGIGDTYLDGTNNSIVLDNDDIVGSEIVRFTRLDSPSANTVEQDQVSATSSLFLNQEMRTQYGIDVRTGTTQGGNSSTNTPEVASRVLALGASTDSYTLSNPSELPNNSSVVGYEFWRRQLLANGGNGTKQYPTQPEFYSEFTARRRIPIDGNITVSVPKFHLNSEDGNQNIVISNASTGADYRIKVTASSSGSPISGSTVGTITAGGGTITLTTATLPPVGETASYKVYLRETGTSNSFNIEATGTNVTFTIGRIESFNFPLKLDNSSPFNNNIISNTVVVDGISPSEVVTVTVTDSSGTTQSWATTSVGTGSFTNSNKTIVDGQNLRARIQSSSVSGGSRIARVSLTGPTSGIIQDATYEVVSGDNSSGTGGSGNSEATYGLEIYSGGSPNNVIVGGGSRLPRLFQSGTRDVYGTGGAQSNIETITLPNFTGNITTDEWAVVVIVNSQFAQSYELPSGREVYDISFPAADQIRITNNNAQSAPEYTRTRYNYWVFRK